MLQHLCFDSGTDKKIDALVYELYGLSEEEIRIVEGVEKNDLELLNKKS
jgi:hypothetical protein